jgi:hypothetical protein
MKIKLQQIHFGQTQTSGLAKWRRSFAILAAACGLAVLSSASAQQIVGIGVEALQYGDTGFSPLPVFNGQGVLGGASDIYWNGYTNVASTITNLLDSQGNPTTLSFSASQGGNDVTYNSDSPTDALPDDGSSPAFDLWGQGVLVRFGDTVVFTISGLATNQVYELVNYSSMGLNEGATYKGAVTGTVLGNNRSTFVLNGNYLDSKPITPNAAGQIIFSITSPSSTAVSGWNGLQIQQMVPTSYIPVVTSLSSNMTYLPGSSVTLSASVDSGSLQAYYQWYLGANPVLNATNASLTITSLTAAQAGSYSLVVTNSAGAAAPCPIAVVTLDTTTTLNLFTGGDAGEGLDLSGNFALAEDYGGYAQPMTIQNANFVVNESRTGGSINGGVPASQPNMGTTLNDTNAAMICNSFDQANGSTLSFTVPNTAGQSYKLQLLFHDANYLVAGQRPMSVSINSEIVDPYLDLPSLYAAGTEAQGAVISYYFTGTGTDLPITITGLKTGFLPILNAMTLEALPTSPQLPYFVGSLSNQTASLGANVTFSSTVGGSAPPFYYQWAHQGTNLPGQNANTLNINVASTNVAGLYTLIVSNSVGVVSNSATLTVIANVYKLMVTGADPGQGLYLQGNFVLAEFFTTFDFGSQLPIGDALFTGVAATNAGGASLGGTSVPNFQAAGGTNLDNLNLSEISSTFSQLITNFNIPTTANATYRLQLIMHDGSAGAGSRIFSISAINSSLVTNVLVSGLDLASLNSSKAIATNVNVVYYFTGDGNPLNLSFSATTAGTAGSPILNALTLEQLTPLTTPTVVLPLATPAAYLGDSVQWESYISGEQVSYQWQIQSNGVYNNIVGATSNILNLTSLSAPFFTNYQVIASNPAGTITNKGSLLQLQYQPQALIGQWLSGGQTLSDQSGFVSGSSHDGVFVTSGIIGSGSPVWASDVPPGFTGSSLDLSTVANTAVMIGNSAMGDLNYNGLFDRSISNAVTVTFWAKGWPAVSSGCFVGKRGENVNLLDGWQVRKYSTTTFASTAQYNTTGAGERVAWLGDANDTTDWHHYAYSWSGGTNNTGGVRNFYVDNTLVESQADSGLEGISPWNHLMLGGENNYPAYQNYASVKLFDVRVYGYALNAAAIQGVNQMPARNPFVQVTGPAQGQGLDLQENFVLSEYYGGNTKTNTYIIGGAVFAPVTNRVYGTPSTQNKPNFGTNADQQNLAILSSQMISMTNSFYLPGVTNTFAISNLVSGHQYSLQLLFHDNNNEAGQHKEFTVQIGTNNYTVFFPNNTPQGPLQQMLDLGARGASYTSAADVALPYTFTSDGTPLQICLGPILGTYPGPILNALTLADLSLPVTAPVWLAQTTNVQSSSGLTVQMMGNAAGAHVTYQWQELVGGVFVSLTDGGTISGSQQNAIMITPVRGTNSGTYRLAASNSAGTIYSTNSLAVTVTAPSAVSFGLTNSVMTLGWTNGSLEESPALSGTNAVWTILTNNSPFVLPVNGTTGNMFYRAVNQ